MYFSILYAWRRRIYLASDSTVFYYLNSCIARITLKSTLCGPLNELCMQQTTSFRYVIRFVLVHNVVVVVVVVYPITLFSNYPTLPTNNPLFSINFSIKTTLHTTHNKSSPNKFFIKLLKLQIHILPFQKKKNQPNQIKHTPNPRTRLTFTYRQLIKPSRTTLRPFKL